MSSFPAVAELLPHKPPMIVVDAVTAAGPDWIESVTRVGPSHALLDDTENGLPGWALIELMAQTIGLHGGWLARGNDEPVRIGYLLGTRRFEMQRTVIPAGATVTVRATREFADPDGVSAYDCVACVGDDIVASAKLNVYRQQDGEGPA